MNKITIKCPKCGGMIETDNDSDTFFCSFCGCGYKILQEGQSGSSRPSKLRIMVLEQEDRMADKKYEESRNSIHSKESQKTPINIGSKVFLLIFLIAFVVMTIVFVILNT